MLDVIERCIREITESESAAGPGASDPRAGALHEDL
jgi:hypothetical protein